MSDDTKELQRRVDELEAEIRDLRSAKASVPFGEGLSEREALLSEAERIAHMGSWMWDTQSGVVRWSDGFYRVWGLEPGEVTPSSEGFFAAIHPEDLPRVQATAERGLASGQPEPVEFRVCRPDGTVREVRMAAAVIQDPEGVPLRLVGTVLDVTDAHRAERLLQRTASELNEAQRVAGVGSFTWDVVNEELSWSDELFRIHGLEPGGKRPDLRNYEQIHPDDRERVERCIEGALHTGTAEPLAFRIVRTDGAVRHVYMHVRVTRDEKGRPLRIVGTILDNTERLSLEQQLFHSQRMEAIGTLAGGVAHDFNNYLLVIEGNAELLAQMVPREGSVSDSIQEILRACERCTSLTRQLLTVGRKQVYDPSVLDLNDIVLAVHRMLERVIGEQITVETELADGLRQVRADGTQLEQAILNLAVNARDAMPQGGTLRIETDNVFIDAEYAERYPELTPGPYVRLVVRDEGEGIPPEILSRAFEPFFTTKPPGKGSGLGLSTVYGIVAQGGGIVTLDSEVGEGTEAKVYLPAVADSQGLASDHRARGAGGSERVLLVEDQPQVRQLVRTLLERGGYRVLEAEDGQQALAVAAEHRGRIDLLLTDVMMPRMGGLELARRLRRERPDVPVIFMSGYADEGEALEGIVEQGFPFIQKPFTLRDLLAEVRRALDEAPRSLPLDLERPS